ncbi:MAG: hypothetical protein ABUL48_04555 [Pseudorhodoplanes sp.]
MSRLSKTIRMRTLAPALMLGALLGGCSDIYYDRRDSISLASGDAVASNRVAQMVDPWPPASANRNIPANGERMQAAVERYRHNRVIAPVNATTSSAGYAQAAQNTNAAIAQAATSGGWAPPPAPSVK